MYRPNRSFMKQLKAKDKNLDCNFNRDTGKFNITYKRATGLPVPIIQVSSESGGYRQPDARELSILSSSDMSNTSTREALNKTSKYMQDYREKVRRQARENIRDMTKDNKYQLKNVFDVAATGSRSTHFRKIEPKASGKSPN